MTLENAKTMAFGRVNAFLVLVHGDEDPSDAEWDRWVDFCLETGFMDGTKIRALVISHGGTPSARQRKRMHEVLNEALRRNPQVVQCAIVTPSTFVRGVANAINILNPVLRAFAPVDIDRAYVHLDMPSAYIGKIERMIGRLEAELGLRTA